MDTHCAAWARTEAHGRALGCMGMHGAAWARTECPPKFMA